LRNLSQFPDDKIEREVLSRGKTVCGIDEVGRGAWAGPLVLAAVVPGDGMIDGVRDSKKISPKKRESLAKEIHSWATSIGFGVVSNSEIDEMGLSRAITLGSKRALIQVEQSGISIDEVLLDGNYDFLKDSKKTVRTYIKGDNLSHLIAAASIVAKVYRDNMMASEAVAGKYPEFMFESNKGYPSPVHKTALSQLGATPIHRVSWNIFQDSFPKSGQEALI
jgi:ribonuclease HII